MCQFLGRQGANDLFAIADMPDGTAVYANSLIGGLAEVMVTNEEWVVPIFTKATAADLGMVCSCVSVAGLGATTSPTLALVQPASIVAVVGCGPLGLSAIQGARIAGASTIIAIDPISKRREVALKVGATHALDPGTDRNGIVQRVRALSSGPNNRLWSGGRDSGGLLGEPARISSSKLQAPMPSHLALNPVPIQQEYWLCRRRTICAPPADTS
jgi:S-(hydroxymethyl)glutathione dehydrogenase/alcohol dehydrogenase